MVLDGIVVEEPDFRPVIRAGKTYDSELRIFLLKTVEDVKSMIFAPAISDDQPGILRLTVKNTVPVPDNVLYIGLFIVGWHYNKQFIHIDSSLIMFCV